MRPDGRGQAWWWPVVPTVAAGGLALPLIDMSTLGSAGLAFPAIATLFAVFLCSPIARQDWLEPFDSKTTIRVSDALAQTVLFGSVCAGTASLTPEGFVWMVPCAWAAALGVSFCGRLTPVATGALIAGVLCLATWKAGTAAPWSLLDPSLESAGDWLPRALLCGALASGAPGLWKLRAPPRPGRLAAPHLAVGAGLLGVLAACVLWAAHYESGTAGLGSKALIGIVIGGSVATILQDFGRSRRVGFVLAGLLGSLWFLLTDPTGIPLWWTTWAPALLGLSWALDAWGRRSVVTATAAGILVFAGIWGFPGVPSLIPPAIAAVLPVVVALWFVGTQTLRSRA